MMLHVQQYCTYIHARPNGLPFYVGKGKERRALNLNRK